MRGSASPAATVGGVTAVRRGETGGKGGAVPRYGSHLAVAQSDVAAQELRGRLDPPAVDARAGSTNARSVRSGVGPR